MRVLRVHKEDIMTILEVLVHDPLYNWSMTPEKAFRLQHGREPDEKTKNKWAQQRQVRAMIYTMGQEQSYLFLFRRS